jgi:hypothetical protein
MTSHGHVRELRRALAARFTLKAFHIVAQGKAMRVKRAWPPPWVIVYLVSTVYIGRTPNAYQTL